MYKLEQRQWVPPGSEQGSLEMESNEKTESKK